MVTQLLIAYCAGMVLTIGMEIAKVIKARRLNQSALMQGTISPAAAPRYNSAPSVNHVAGAAANEMEPMRAAG